MDFKSTLLLLFCTVLPLSSAPVADRAPEPNAGIRITPVVRAVQSVMPSVVNVGTERIVRVSDPFDAFFNEFFGGHPGNATRESVVKIPLGSGVIIDSQGLALTNYHVVARASQVMLRLWDGRTCTASAVATDVANDLALLQIEGDFTKNPLQSIRFALPDDLILGETVVTVGNPFGLEHSVASGILSARNRSLRGRSTARTAQGSATRYA